MKFGILGRLQVVDDDMCTVPVAAPRQRAVLAALLLNANRILPADALAETLWDGAPPAGAANTVRAYVMRLRKSLGSGAAARIETHDPGYLIHVEPDEFDATAFDALCRQAGAAVRAGDQWGEATVQATRALALWRGSPLIDVPSRVLRDAWVPHYELQHLQLLEWRIEAELASGGSDALIPEINSLVKQNALREPLYRLQMLALAHADRPGEALAVYREARAVLIEQLGVEPGAELQRLHQLILNGANVRMRPKRSAQTQLIPRQLPADTRIFTGRGAELDELLAVAETSTAGTEAGMVVVSAIDGMGGIGKSALAVHAAHRLAAQFPDGQLFVDLRGYAADLEPLPPEEALDHLLRSLGVAPEQISGDLASRAALYRTQLAGTKTLIVLDNAAGASQVRPLLPGEPGSLVLITSRRRLPGLDDAHSLTLGVLSDSEAAALLHKAAGPGRIPAQHAGISELIRLCGNLPLALRIAGSRLRHHRSLQVDRFIDQLRDEQHGRLAALEDEDRGLAAVFNTSYASLTRAERRLYRSLSVVPGPDFDVSACAALIGLEPRETERLLESLLDHSLLLQHSPGRYRFHDLVRIHARECAEVDEDPVELERVLIHLCTWYVRTALAASRQIYPRRSVIDIDGGEPVGAKSFNSRDAALVWCDAERANLIAAVHACGARGLRALAWQLPVALAPYFNLRKAWQDWIATHEIGLLCAQQSGDRYGEAHVQVGLGRAYTDLKRFDEADHFYQQAADGYRELGHESELLRVMINLAALYNQRGWSERGYDASQEALRIARAIGDTHSQSVVLGNLGTACAELGRLDEAVDHFRRALAMREAENDRYGQGLQLQNLAEALRELGRNSESAECCARAMKIHLEDGNRYGEAVASLSLGDLALDRSDPTEARGHWTRALTLFEDLGSPRAAEAANRLNSL
jgi:DNA-binding SARP family transcriptional activator/tetratricopeptide (TPR) repeat protein